jgi:hypothetical protein
MAAESIDRHDPGPVRFGTSGLWWGFNRVTLARSLFQQLSGFGDVLVGPPDGAVDWCRRGR